ncbi:MAG: hypothetical protein V8S34_03345 [Lawsonibacter sp.]
MEPCRPAEEARLRRTAGAGAGAPAGQAGPGPERLRRRDQGPCCSALAAAAQELLDRDEAVGRELPELEEKVRRGPDAAGPGAGGAGAGQGGPGRGAQRHQRL